MVISVIIPTYERPEHLMRCLEALSRQERPADDLIVAVRDIDRLTHDLLDKRGIPNLPLRKIIIELPGQVAALNAALNVARGDIIAFTDDDAAPHPDWLRRIEIHFNSDPGIGGVGGRDCFCHGEYSVNKTRRHVGRFYWFGWMGGNHHLGIGKPREVDALKGVNMSYRRRAIQGIQFDTRLRGNRDQVHNDMAFSLAVKRAGWKLIYDPAVVVDHYLAGRDKGNKWGNQDISVVEETAYNETLIILDNFSQARKFAFIIWALMIGNFRAPGLILAVYSLFFLKGKAISRLCASLKGRWEGWKAWLSKK